MSRIKSRSAKSYIQRKDQVIDFLNFVARKAKVDNIDQFFRNGKIIQSSDLFDCGRYFLEHALGCGENDFIPNINFKEFSCFVPQSEHYYPWVFFVVPSSVSDLPEFFDHHGRNYLMSADAGKKDYAVITNLKTISVFDFNHFQDKYEVSIVELYDSLVGEEPKKSLKSWVNFIEDFGPDKVEERKKSRRKEVIQYVEPKEASPQLRYVKRFGHMPNLEIPVGYDGQNFRETFKTKDLPFLTTEIIDWDGNAKKIENKLIWGDNLAVMRSLPDQSIDLIYIDPPFFSGKDYNKIFGDDDEVRTFSDIWDGGLPTYLAWLNARLWEMKRLLKPTGSIYVHLDWHVSHYAKCEMDKIFGNGGKDGNGPGFKANIIWSYSWGVRTENRWNRKHDDILFYTKEKNFTFNANEVLEDRKLVESSKKRLEYRGALIKDHNKRGDSEKALPTDVWHIATINGMAAERIGYPTQKPEALIEKIILASTNPGDVVADFFSGGGTTAAVAEKLNRRWIGCDISRIAVSVARDRISSIYTKEAGLQPKQKQSNRGFSIQYNGVYERDMVRELDDKGYRKFILDCYQAVERSKGDYIHGFKDDDRAIYVSPANKNLRKDQIEEFHSELSHYKIRNGVILTWNVSKEAEKYVDELRRGVSGPDIQIVQVRLVDIDSNEFKGENIRFINKPAAVIKSIHKAGLTWIFDATASCGGNGSDIHYYQWDFNYKNRFSPTTKPNFKDGDGDGNPLNDYRRIEFTFPEEGKFKVALRIFDKSGAEATHIAEINTSKTSKKAG
jgi:DNA modification methylase